MAAFDAAADAARARIGRELAPYRDGFAADSTVHALAIRRDGYRAWGGRCDKQTPRVLS